MNFLKLVNINGFFVLGIIMLLLKVINLFRVLVLKKKGKLGFKLEWYKNNKCL